MEGIMKHESIVNLYFFIRSSTYNDGREPQEDFDTIANQIRMLKEYDLPATYALKYDALMNPMYQALVKENLDENDDLGVWWEITKPLAEKAGIYSFQQKEGSNLHVEATYSLSYTNEERRRLLDVFMEDFYQVFQKYPTTIASWVMDIETYRYAHEKYGLVGGGICRDQIGIDGFTLWGGYANGLYYPSKYNEYLPAQTKETQLDMPIVRLLGPDPIYNIEALVRDGISGIFTLEPAWIYGQSEHCVSTFFENMTEEVQLGYAHAQVGQENSFLWPNVAEGFEMQIRMMAKLLEEKKIVIETIADTCKWFKQKYALTPPISFNASKDFTKSLALQCTWYTSRYYRLSMLLEEGQLCIRDFFIFDEDFESKYLKNLFRGDESTFEALPILDMVKWSKNSNRKVISLLWSDTKEAIKINGWRIETKEELGEMTVILEMEDASISIQFREAGISMSYQSSLDIKREFMFSMEQAPISTKIEPSTYTCHYQGRSYGLECKEGKIEEGMGQVFFSSIDEKLNLDIFPCKGKEESYLLDATVSHSVKDYYPNYSKIRLIPPKFVDEFQVKYYGQELDCILENPNHIGQIYYTIDGAEPTADSFVYENPIKITADIQIKACVIAEGRKNSDTVVRNYENTLKIKKIESPTPYDVREEYNKKGVLGLVDHKKGSLNHVDREWLITRSDLEFTIELEEDTYVESFQIGLMQNVRVGALYPEYMELSVGDSLENQTVLETKKVQAESGFPDLEIKEVIFNIKQKVRYIKVKANPYSNEYIFMDEIMLKK